MGLFSKKPIVSSSNLTNLNDLIDFNPTKKWLKIYNKNIGNQTGDDIIYKINYENLSLIFNLSISKNAQGVFFHLVREFKPFSNQVQNYDIYDVPDNMELNDKGFIDIRWWFVSYDFYNRWIDLINQEFRNHSQMMTQNITDPQLKSLYEFGVYNFICMKANNIFANFFDYELLSNMFIAKSFDLFNQRLKQHTDQYLKDLNTLNCVLNYYTKEREDINHQLVYETKWLSKKLVNVNDLSEDQKVMYQNEMINIDDKIADEQPQKQVLIDEYPLISKKFNELMSISIDTNENLLKYEQKRNELFTLIDQTKPLKEHKKQKVKDPKKSKPKTKPESPKDQNDQDQSDKLSKSEHKKINKLIKKTIDLQDKIV